jgi:hypothetical protein
MRFQSFFMLITTQPSFSAAADKPKHANTDDKRSAHTS